VFWLDLVLASSFPFVLSSYPVYQLFG
jgi:hypothetical protein